VPSNGIRARLHEDCVWGVTPNTGRGVRTLEKRHKRRQSFTDLVFRGPVIRMRHDSQYADTARPMIYDCRPSRQLPARCHLRHLAARRTTCQALRCRCPQASEYVGRPAKPPALSPRFDVCSGAALIASDRPTPGRGLQSAVVSTTSPVRLSMSWAPSAAECRARSAMARRSND
jgi:hypothetical protein